MRFIPARYTTLLWWTVSGTFNSGTEVESTVRETLGTKTVSVGWHDIPVDISGVSRGVIVCPLHRSRSPVKTEWERDRVFQLIWGAQIRGSVGRSAEGLESGGL